MKLPSDIAARAKGFAGRGWVAREVADWVARGEERFLAIVGEPGSGKTALAAWLAGAGPRPARSADARALDRVRDAWTATHFCMPRRDGSVDGEAFGAAIAGQLAKGLGDDYLPAVARANGIEITARISAATINAPTTGIKIAQLVIAAQSRADTAANVTAVWQGAVRKPLLELAKRRPGPKAFILVDALDEANRVPRPNIVSLLEGSDDLPPGVRFLVTMTTELDPRALFPDARVIDLSAPAHRQDADDDVRAFVRSRLKPSRAVEDALVDAAAGNFLYIRFLVEEVERGRPLERLDALPAGLYPLYSAYLDRVTRTDPGQPPGSGWEEELQPLLGCISVATPSAPRPLLPQWLDREDGRVGRLLTQARQLTERDMSPDGPGYRLYHRSMADFLAAPEYGTDGTAALNRYHTPPATQHARIAATYLDQFVGADWRQADSYGLRNVARHLAAAAAAERLPARRRERTAALYRTVLDPEFQAAQKQLLGDVTPTLADLRMAIDTALAGDDVVPLLRCVAAFRGVTQSGVIAESIFGAVDRGDFANALRDAEHYGPPPRPRGRWARVLDAWIAWQAARAGRAEEARRAAQGVVGQWVTADSDAEPLYWDLSRALIVRTGRALVTAGLDPEPLLRVFPDDGAALARDVAAAPEPPASDAETASLLDELRDRLEAFERQLDIDPYEAVEVPFANAEMQAWQAGTLRDLLVRLAARPEGRDGIELTLAPTLRNPYARYRDIGLVALGTAVVAVPDDAWADGQLRAILLAGLDVEGVTFTFDLPTRVLDELGHRGRTLPELEAYLARAELPPDEDDRWVMGMRLQNARAATLGARGDRDGALDILVEASRRPSGFAGHTSAAYLALANRCVELGRADAIDSAVWGANGGWRLVDLVAEQAGRILDLDFREERRRLVERYAEWLNEPPPDLAAVQAFVGETPDPDARRTYKDFAAAHWVAGGTTEGRDGLKALVPMVLQDSTTLDAMLARVIGPRLAALDDAELDRVAEVVATSLTGGRPWELDIGERRWVGYEHAGGRR